MEASDPVSRTLFLARSRLSVLCYRFLFLFTKLKSKGEIENLPYLVYWFDSPDKHIAECFSLERNSDFVEKGDDDIEIPKHIQNKLMDGEKLSDEDQRLMNGLRSMKKAKEGEVPFLVPQDHELFKLVPTTSASPLYFPMPKQEETAVANPKIEHAAATNTTSNGDRTVLSMGTRVSVFWEMDKEWYKGYIGNVRNEFYLICYDDDETEWLPLAEHKFKILDNGGIQGEAEEDSCNAAAGTGTPFSTPNKKKKIRDEEMDWLPEEEEGTTKLSKKTAARKSPVKPSPQSLPRQLKNAAHRFTEDGFIKPVKTPRRNPKGFYDRPIGRAPSGFDWNRRKGLWAPILSSPKRKGSADFDQTIKPAKLSKSAVADDQSSNNCGTRETDDESSFETLPKKAARSSSETLSGDMPLPTVAVNDESQASRIVSFLSKDTADPQAATVKASNMNLNIAARLMDDLAKELVVAGLDTAATERCRKNLESLNKLDVPWSRVKTGLSKSIRKVRKHPILGGLAKALIKKWQKAYFVELVSQWKDAVDAGDVPAAIEKVKALYSHVEAQKNPLELTEDFIAEHDLRDRVRETWRLFDDKNVVCEELDALDDMIDLEVSPGATGIV